MDDAQAYAGNKVGFLVRWIRLLWPEVVFGALWLVLVCLGRIAFTDDEMWQHRAIDALQWAALVGYVTAAAVAHLRPSANGTATD